MQTLNGATPSASPPPVSVAAVAPSAKRKLDDISTDAIVNGENTANDRNGPKDVQDSIREIWQALSAQDISPLILQHISTHETSHDLSGDESSGKRAKLSPSPPNQNIASKISQGHYRSYDSFVVDIENACSDMLKSSKREGDTANGPTQWPASAQPALEAENVQASLSGMKNLINNLVSREKQRLEPKTSNTPQATKQEEEEEEVVLKVNGINHQSDSPRSAASVEQPHRTVLTLYGNAQGHRQLFSSFQKPISKPTHPNQPNHTAAPTVTEPISLREEGLPIGISSTKIIPVPKDAADKDAKPRRTMQDVFASPSSIRNLPPPKTPKLVTSRESAITWSRGTPSDQNPRAGGYANEKLATGAWLGYDGLAPAEEPSSPQAKRKQRDRALSIGEGNLTPSRDAKAAQLQAQEEALFRSAYSSFAPSRDNSYALVPEETRNEIWWGKYGANYFHQEFAIDSSLESQDEELDAEEQFQDKESLFREAVEQFVPIKPPIAAPAEISEDKDAEEMLLEISQMLETLHSYQRIRMVPLSTGSRTSLVLNSTLQDLTGNPSTPSTAEIETYKTLRSQLALIVSMLPPYAVSKLNGDQLADLNLSREIPIEVEEYRGVMEEDKASRDAKQAAFQAAVGAAAATNRQTPLLPAPQHQARTAQMPQPSRGHNQNQLHYNNTPQTMPKAQSQFSRQPLSSWQKPSQNFTANTQRPAYANPQSFNPSIPRNVNPAVRQQYSQMTQPRPGNIPQFPNGASPATPQLSYQPRMQNQGSPTYTPTNGSFVASPSPSQNIQRNYQPQMQYQPQNQQGHLQQPYTSQAPLSQQNWQIPQSPHGLQQLGNQIQENSSQPALENSSQPPQPPSQLAPPPVLSPLPRPPSPTGLVDTGGNGDTDGVAVTSRSSTPLTPAQIQTQAQDQPQASPLAKTTPITQG